MSDLIKAIEGVAAGAAQVADAVAPGTGIGAAIRDAEAVGENVTGAVVSAFGQIQRPVAPVADPATLLVATDAMNAAPAPADPVLAHVASLSARLSAWEAWFADLFGALSSHLGPKFTAASPPSAPPVPGGTTAQP